MNLKKTVSHEIQNANNQKLSSMDNLQKQQSYYTNQSKFNRATQIVLENRSVDNLSKHSKAQRQENLTNIQKRQKLPQSLKLSLIQRSKDSGKFHQTSQIKKSKFGGILASKMKKELFVCAICFAEMKEKQKIKLCNCQHIFCSPCLNQYVLYKVGMFQQILCPEQECNTIMSQETNFYKSLPEITKQKYIKIHNFYATANDPSLKLCPKEECDGIIKILQGQPRICDRCQTEYCPKCYFKKHEGQCQKNQIDFFQDNLHYRQCSNCKFVVERIEGCNHMTCRCKHQFCYICGADWSNGHLCNGQVQPGAQQPCCDCSCCDQTCGPFACVFKIPLKLILFILFFACVVLVLLNKIMVFALLFVFVLLAGMFFFSIDYICTLFDQDRNCLGCFLIVLFPIAMIIGIGMATKEVLCDVMGEEMRQLCDMITDGTTGICNI